jgi:hypothetical protein
MLPSPDKGPVGSVIHRLFVPFLLVLSGAAAVYVNFPLGDSWTHGWTVDQWLKGNFVMNDWSSAVALPQQILGWLINLGAGSVQWWRLSVLTAVVTVSGCIIASELPGKLFPHWPALKGWSPLFAIVMLAAPFTLKIASGFMTDGYYFLFMTAALWLLIDLVSNPAKHSDSQWFMKWSIYGLLALLASLQRTHGFLLLLIPGIWMIFAKVIDRDPDRREGWSAARTTHAVVVCLLGFVVGISILAIPSLDPARSREVMLETAWFWLGKQKSFLNLIRVHLIFGIFQHLGFSLLPVAMIARLQKTASESEEGRLKVNWWYVGFGVVFLLSTFLMFAANRELFPYIGNSLTHEGFGPRADTIAVTAGHVMPLFMAVILTCLGTLGGMAVLWLLSRSVRVRGVDWRAPSTLIGILGIAHLLLVFINPHFFDRYLLPLMPFILCWLAPFLRETPPKARLAGWTIVLIFLAWSLVGTIDYLNWTKSKWDLAAELRSRGVQSNQIVGGYEVDGFFNFTNGNYPGLDFGDNPMLPWWVDRLGLPITADYVIVEQGSYLQATPYSDYAGTQIENGRMRVYAAPGVETDF